MMNKTKIDWCDFTWNPVTGCRHGCEYCYAARQARRFSGDVRLNLGSPQITCGGNVDEKLYILDKPFKNGIGKVIPLPAGFAPTLHKYRLEQPEQKKKPANIFVVSMGDLFGEWVPAAWIRQVMSAASAAPWHNYLFLTKNPARYDGLPDSDNWWFGTTCNCSRDLMAPGRAQDLYTSSRFHTFISIEPLQEELSEAALNNLDASDWIIIGAETGNRTGKVMPQRSWVEAIVDVCEKRKIPYLMKDSEELRAVWDGDLHQEFPPALVHHYPDIPHCLSCSSMTGSQDGERGIRHQCTRSGRHIPGRYVVTSPPWCPLRETEKGRS